MESELSKRLIKKLRVKGAVLLTDFVSSSFLDQFPMSECGWDECGPLHVRHYLRCLSPTGKLHAVQTGGEEKGFEECF